MYHCWSSEIPLFEAQYSTRPAGKNANSTANATGSLHDLALHRIHPRGRREPLRDDHERAVDDRQDEQRIGLAEIRHPEEAGLAQFDRFEQHPVQGNEDWNLDKNGQAAAERVHLFLLVDFHHGLAELLAVVAVTFVELLVSP